MTNEPVPRPEFWIEYRYPCQHVWQDMTDEYENRLGFISCVRCDQTIYDGETIAGTDATTLTLRPRLKLP